MESGDSEYEEEEVVVLAELVGLVDDELLRKGCTYQFVGIDTDKPVLQLGKYNFLGSYEDQVGSALFLKESVDEEGHKTWSKLCFSDKKLAMQRVFLRKKGDELPTPSEGAEEATAMEEGAAAVPEPAVGREPGKEQEPELGPKPGPSAVADDKLPEQDEKRPEQDEKRPEQDEKRPEQAVDAESATAASSSSAAASSSSASAAAAADEVSSDVDMPPAKGTETAPSQAESSADKPSPGSEH